MDLLSISCLFGLLCSLTGQVAAQQEPYFVLFSGMPVTIERLDPLLNPGKTPSQHVFSVVGGNAFAPTMNLTQTQKSSCSTVNPIADKSNYLMPNLYFHDPQNGSFIRVPEQPDHSIYYRYGNSKNVYDSSIQEFPKEFRMRAGDPTVRSQKSVPAGTGLQWTCLSSGNPALSAVGFPSGFTSCDLGLRASLTMPSCWNGNAFNAASPSAHMAYPSGDGIQGCPVGFRVARFPAIFVEYYLDVHTFNGLYTPTDHPWVLSMGDPTGYGFHVEFINGWKPGVLNATMPTCNPGSTNNPPLSDPACFGGSKGGIYSAAQQKACLLKPIVNEDVGWTYPKIDNSGGTTYGGVLAALPGCNPVQGGPGPTTPKIC